MLLSVLSICWVLCIYCSWRINSHSNSNGGWASLSKGPFKPFKWLLLTAKFSGYSKDRILKITYVQCNYIITASIWICSLTHPPAQLFNFSFTFWEIELSCWASSANLLLKWGTPFGVWELKGASVNAGSFTSSMIRSPFGKICCYLCYLYVEFYVFIAVEE